MIKDAPLVPVVVEPAIPSLGEMVQFALDNWAVLGVAGLIIVTGAATVVAFQPGQPVERRSGLRGRAM